MTGAIDIRESVSGNVPAIEKIYSAAFPEEDLLPLVVDLLALSKTPTVLSLAAFEGREVVGHIVFTACRVTGADVDVALLGPLCVAPSRQRQGIGGALIGAGLERLKKQGVSRVFVLGDPAYYGRFGFTSDDYVAPPYELPKEWHGAWQSLCLYEDTSRLTGTLAVPEPWRQQTLWTP
ncbi:MAG: N-acetyltransferase [Rhodospirillaceae bacterium]|jgi:putative acetyltransferase